MKLGLARHLIALLTVVGLLFGAVFSAAAASASIATATVAVGDESPPCHHSKAPDSSKSCLAAALCMAKCFQAVPARALSREKLVHSSGSVILPGDVLRAGPGVPPPLRPPRRI